MYKKCFQNTFRAPFQSIDLNFPKENSELRELIRVLLTVTAITTPADSPSVDKERKLIEKVPQAVQSAELRQFPREMRRMLREMTQVQLLRRTPRSEKRQLFQT